MGTNKTNEVLKHLQTYGSITSIEAINLFGATRLSAIIFNLRKKGYSITSVTRKTKDRYRHVVSYAEYILNGTTNAVLTMPVENNTLFQYLLEKDQIDE